MTCVDDQKTRLMELINDYATEVADCGGPLEIEETAWQLLMRDAIDVAQQRARPGRYPYHGMGIISQALDAALDEMHAEAAA